MRASIITPTFNAQEYILGCIENVKAQGDVVLEHIIADGGSTDGTVELIEEAQKSHSALRLLRGPDQGQSDAMNKATAIACGDMIGILNADDFYELGAVSRGAQELQKLARPALVCGDCRILDEAGKVRLINKPRDLRLEALLQDSWLFPIPANPSAYFYTKDVHDIVGGYNISDTHAMDCEFLLLCAERIKMMYIPELWGNFRFIPGCKTFDDTEGAARVSEIIEKYKSKLTLAQKSRMSWIKTMRKSKMRAGNVLRKFGMR